MLVNSTFKHLKWHFFVDFGATKYHFFEKNSILFLLKLKFSHRDCIFLTKIVQLMIFGWYAKLLFRKELQILLYLMKIEHLSYVFV